MDAAVAGRALIELEQPAHRDMQHTGTFKVPERCACKGGAARRREGAKELLTRSPARALVDLASAVACLGAWMKSSAENG